MEKNVSDSLRMATSNSMSTLTADRTKIMLRITDIKDYIDSLSLRKLHNSSQKSLMERESSTMGVKLLEMTGDHASKQVEVTALRKQSNEFDAQSMVDRDVVSAGIKLMISKVETLVQSISKSDAQVSDLRGKLAVACESMQRTRAVKEGLENGLASILDEREKFLKNKTELFQRLRFAESSQALTLRMLESREVEYDRLVHLRNRQSLEIKSLRDKEYETLDGVRQAHVSLAKAESDLIHIRKRTDLLRTSLANCSRRFESVIRDIEAKADTLASERSQLVNNDKLLGDMAERIQLLIRRDSRCRSELEETQAILSPLLEECARLDMHSDSCDSDRVAIAIELSEAESELCRNTREVDRVINEFNEEHGRKKPLVEEVNMLKNNIIRIRRTNASTDRPPVLIEAGSESRLLDRLQINAFLRESQSKSNSLSLLVDKIAELLGHLIASRLRSDTELSSLGKLTSQLSAMRRQTVEAFDKMSELRTSKAKSLTTYIFNELNSNFANVEMCFNKVSLVPSDIELIHRKISEFGGIDRISKISFCKTSLSDDSLSVLLLILNDCPYLVLMDLRENSFSVSCTVKFSSFLNGIAGITTVCRIGDSPGEKLIAYSGKVIRLTVDLCLQSSDMMQPGKEWLAEAGKTSIVGNSATSVDESAPSGEPQTAVPGLGYVEQAGLKVSEKVLPRVLASKSSISSKKRVPMSRQSSSPDSSFRRQVAVSQQIVSNKAHRLGIKTLLHDK